MLPDNNIKENLSFAYVKIIASMTGRVFEERHQDFGNDGQIVDIQYHDNQISENGINLDVQIKSTSNFDVKDNFVIYQLRNKNYNDLASNTTITPRILILFCIPKDKEEWILQNHDLLELRKCTYWYSLKGFPKKEKKDSRTIIKISKDNIFSVENLNRIFDKIKRGEDLNDV